MRLYINLIICLGISLSLSAQTASFAVPDTVCVGSPVTITDQSVGVNSWHWNFCSGKNLRPPDLVNNGNPSGYMETPTHSIIVEEGGQFHVFVTNATNSNIVRLDYGNSLDNTPTAVTFPQLTGLFPNGTSGIQAVEDGNGKHLIVVSGNEILHTSGNIARIDFGNSWANTTSVTGVDWGNPGNLLAFCGDLAIVKENNQYVGFVVGWIPNVLVRVEFGTDFSTVPTLVSMGALGGTVINPGGLRFVKEGPNWYGFMIATSGLYRLDFGTTLSNAPTLVNLGNPGGWLSEPKDLTIYQDCDEVMMLVADKNQIIRLNFAGGVTGTISAASYGSPFGILRNISGISRLYRDATGLKAVIAYGYRPAGSVAMWTMDGCPAPLAPAHIGQSPAAFTITAAGTYYINLVTDQGTPDERFFCKRIVAVDPPTLELGNNNILVCNGQPLRLNSITGPRLRYQWFSGTAPRVNIPGENRDYIIINSTNTYGVEIFNGGCTVSDDIFAAIGNVIQVTGDIQNIDCNHPDGSAELTVTGGNSPYTFSLNSQPDVTTPAFASLAAGNYTVDIEDRYGCTGTYNFAIVQDMLRTLTTSATGTHPTCFGSNNGSILAQVSHGVAPLQFALGTGPFGNGPSFNNLTAGTYKVYIRNAYCLDSQDVVLTQPTALLMPYDAYQDTCNRGNGWVQLAPQGGVSPYSVTWNGNVVAGPEVHGLGVGMYTANVMDANGCQRSANIYIPNLSMARMNILTPDTVVAIGDEFVLRAGNAADYIWSPIDVGGIQCPTCPETVVRPVAPTQYIVRTLTGANCVSADTVRVLIDYSSMLEMPNAFTPNNDGVNDLFRPKSKAVMAFSMQVYNRSGNLVFTTNDHRRGWDGNANGKPAPMGTYVYIIKFGFWQADGKIEMQDKKGTFDLIR